MAFSCRIGGHVTGHVGRRAWHDEGEGCCCLAGILWGYMGVIYFIPGVGIRATAMPVASVLSMKSLNLKSYTFTKKQHATYGSHGLSSSTGQDTHRPE